MDDKSITEDDFFYDCVVTVYEHESNQRLTEIGKLQFQGAHMRPELDKAVLKVVEALKDAYEFHPDSYISMRIVNNYSFTNI